MALFATIQPLYIASGFGVGFLVGMTGVGGGSLMTPLLILLFGVNPVTAVGTDLIYASVTKTGGSLVHGFNRTIDWRVVLRLASGSIPAALLTLGAGLGHLASGGVDMGVLVSLLMGSLPGIMLASLFAPRLPDTFLRYTLAVTLTLVAARLLFA